MKAELTRVRVVGTIIMTVRMLPLKTKMAVAVAGTTASMVVMFTTMILRTRTILNGILTHEGELDHGEG